MTHHSEDRQEKPVELTAKRLAACIENEGLHYAVNDYYGRNIKCIDDPKMEELWKSAYDAMSALERHALSIE